MLERTGEELALVLELPELILVDELELLLVSVEEFVLEFVTVALFSLPGFLHLARFLAKFHSLFQASFRFHLHPIHFDNLPHQPQFYH